MVWVLGFRSIMDSIPLTSLTIKYQLYASCSHQCAKQYNVVLAKEVMTLYGLEGASVGQSSHVRQQDGVGSRTELTGDKWPVAYTSLRVTRHKSKKEKYGNCIVLYCIKDF